MPRAPVESVDIAAWNGAAATVQVRAGGPGKVRLTATFTRKDGGEDESSTRILDTQTRTLSGKTDYSLSLSAPVPTVACGERALFGITVATDRPAGNGTQVKEISVEGPRCAPRSSRSALSTAPRSPSGCGRPIPRRLPCDSGSPRKPPAG
ncbi:hypothetical protein ACFQX6_29010 [Streptosporangium lutulentum]